MRTKISHPWKLDIRRPTIWLVERQPQAPATILDLLTPTQTEVQTPRKEKAVVEAGRLAA